MPTYVEQVRGSHLADSYPMYFRKTKLSNTRFGGLTSPGPWMVAIACVLAGLLLFSLDYHRMGFVAALGVLVLIIAGFSSSTVERPTHAPRVLRKKQLQSARRKLAAPRSSLSLDHRAKRALDAGDSEGAENTTYRAHPSRDWRRRRDNSRMIVALLFLAWCAVMGLTMTQLHESLGPSWQKVSKGLTLGKWLVLVLTGVSFACFVPFASWVEGLLTRRPRRTNSDGAS